MSRQWRTRLIGAAVFGVAFGVSMLIALVGGFDAYFWVMTTLGWMAVARASGHAGEALAGPR